jgi:hypothetical protein
VQAGDGNYSNAVTPAEQLAKSAVAAISPQEHGFDEAPLEKTDPQEDVRSSYPATPDSYTRDNIYDRPEADGGNDAGTSPFASEPPFRPRRNPARLWTAAAILFFVLISAAGAALYYYGPPEWAVRHGLVSEGSAPDLLFYLSRPAERRKLPNGQEFFAFSARIVNSGTKKMPVPPVAVEMRDHQDRLVFSWTTKADKAELKPGEEASINESRLDIPKNAENLSLGFVDRGH